MQRVPVYHKSRSRIRTVYRTLGLWTHFTVVESQWPSPVMLYRVRKYVMLVATLSTVAAFSGKGLAVDCRTSHRVYLCMSVLPLRQINPSSLYCLVGFDSRVADTSAHFQSLET